MLFWNHHNPLKKTIQWFFKRIFHLPSIAVKPFIEADFRVKDRTSTTNCHLPQKRWTYPITSLQWKQKTKGGDATSTRLPASIKGFRCIGGRWKYIDEDSKANIKTFFEVFQYQKDSLSFWYYTPRVAFGVKVKWSSLQQVARAWKEVQFRVLVTLVFLHLSSFPGS